MIVNYIRMSKEAHFNAAGGNVLFLVQSGRNEKFLLTVFYTSNTMMSVVYKLCRNEEIEL